MDAGSMEALPYTCCGKKRLGAWTVRQEQKPYTPTWCVCHLGIVGLLLDHTLEITHLCVWMRLYVLSCPYKHTQELADGITAGKWEEQPWNRHFFSNTHVTGCDTHRCVCEKERMRDCKQGKLWTNTTDGGKNTLVNLFRNRQVSLHTHTSRVIFSYTPSLPNTSFWWSLGSQLQSMSTDFLFFL